MEHADNKNTNGGDQGNKNTITTVTLSIEQLARLTKKDATELQESLLTNSDSGEPLSQEQQFSIISDALGDHMRSVAEAQRNRGGKDLLKSKQNALAEKYGVDASGKLEDVMQRIEDKIKISASDIDPNEAFKIEAVQEKLGNFKKLLEEKDKEILSIKSGYEKQETLRQVKQRALDVLTKNNAIFSQDEAIKKRRLEAFYRIIENGNYNVNEKGDVVVLDNDGNVMQDESGYKDLTFDKHVLNNSIFEFGEVTKTNPTPKGPNPKGGDTSYSFTTQELEEYGRFAGELKDKGLHSEADELIRQGTAYHSEKYSKE